MKKLFFMMLVVVVASAINAQGPFAPRYEEKVVYEGPDVIFRQIDDHTWEGNGHLMANESLYLIEGDSIAILLDAGTEIKDLKKIVEGITTKPVTLIATHVHPDHTGKAINDWNEIYINAADMVNVPWIMPDYKGEIKYLNDGQVINLGNREIEVIFTPGHTPGSTSFFDKDAGYGFSGDAFGSGNLLLTTNFSTLRSTCDRIARYMEKNNIKKMYPGHYMGMNPETPQRVKDLRQISDDILDGKIKGENQGGGLMGLDHAVMRDGVRVCYGQNQLK